MTAFYLELLNCYSKYNFNQYSIKNKSLECQTQYHDILFNMHKKVIIAANGDRVEVICMSRLKNLAHNWEIRC